MFFYCLDFYFRLSPSLIIPQLIQQYHTNALGIGAFASAFYLGYVLLQIPGGIILERYSLRSVLVISILLCTISFIIFIYASNFIFGLLLRGFIGATSALSFISVLYIARVYLPLRYFSLISGVTIAAGTLAASLVQIISSITMNYFGWRTVFTFFSLWGIIVAMLLFLPRLNISKPKHLTRFNTQELLQQLLILLRNKKIILNGFVGGLFYLPTSIFAAVWGISFLQSDYAFTRTKASTGIMLLFAGWAVGSPIVGFICGYIHKQYLIIVVSAILAAGISSIILYEPSFTRSWIYCALFLFGLFSSAQTAVWKIFDSHCPSGVTGIGIAVTNMTIMLAGSIFQLFVGWLLTAPATNNKLFLPVNFQLGLSVIPIIFLLAALLSFCFQRHPRAC
jgi:predicted MFS family arabinose efflux permease